MRSFLHKSISFSFCELTKPIMRVMFKVVSVEIRAMAAPVGLNPVARPRTNLTEPRRRSGWLAPAGAAICNVE